MSDVPLDPVSVVDAQVAAYNARNLDEFVATYSPDAVIRLDQETGRGHTWLCATYGPMFASGSAPVEIVARIVVGNLVADHEVVRVPGREIRAVAVYRVVDGRIASVDIHAPSSDA